MVEEKESLESKLDLSEEQKKVIHEMSNLELFIFFQGVSRGCLMALNSVMIRYVKCTLQQYQQRIIKEKIQGIVPVQEIVNMLTALFIESQKQAQKVKMASIVANDNQENKKPEESSNDKQ